MDVGSGYACVVDGDYMSPSWGFLSTQMVIKYVCRFDRRWDRESMYLSKEAVYHSVAVHRSVQMSTTS